MNAEQKNKNIRPGPVETELKRKIDDYISRYRLLREGDRVMIAVSGGPDSVALLYLLSSAGRQRSFDLTVIHLDHCLRGEESRRDAEWVRKCAADLGLPILIEARTLGSLPADGNYSPEEGARRLRYRFFHDCAEKSGIDTVALGHHADDQAETVLLKLLRGSRPGALGGMRPLRRKGKLRIIRPLLEVSRSVILAYLAEIGRDYRKDKSNRDLRFTRNRIRHRLLPLLEKEYNPAIREILVNLAAQERVRERYIRDEAAKYYPDVVDLCEVGIRIDCNELAGIDPALRGEVLRRALESIGLNSVDRRGWSRLFDLIGGRSGRKIDLPGGAAVKNYEELIIAGRTAEPSAEEKYRRRFEVPGKVVVAEAGAVIEARCVPPPPPVREKPDWKELWNEKGVAAPVSEYLDYDRIKPPLFIRHRRPGDRYRPLGAPGSRKLKAIMIDEKIPRSWRQRLPLVLDRDGIILAAGYRPAHRCRLTDQTRRALEITVRPLGRRFDRSFIA